MKPTLEAFGAGFLRLSYGLSASAEAQWQPARRAQPADDTTERSKGITSDPVFRATVDDRRLALRAAVVAAERARADALTAMAHAERVLIQALEKASEP